MPVDRAQPRAGAARRRAAAAGAHERPRRPLQPEQGLPALPRRHEPGAATRPLRAGAERRHDVPPWPRRGEQRRGAARHGRRAGDRRGRVARCLRDRGHARAGPDLRDAAAGGVGAAGHARVEHRGGPVAPGRAGERRAAVGAGRDDLPARELHDQAHVPPERCAREPALPGVLAHQHGDHGQAHVGRRGEAGHLRALQPPLRRDGARAFRRRVRRHGPQGVLLGAAGPLGVAHEPGPRRARAGGPEAHGAPVPPRGQAQGRHHPAQAAEPQRRGPGADRRRQHPAPRPQAGAAPSAHPRGGGVALARLGLGFKPKAKPSRATEPCVSWRAWSVQWCGLWRVGEHPGV
mmetsp:Transcript_37068/g.116025  ORF Transcript_37068/g.116025 Transcript_37068/m.116025 type:complete len:348 (-) Transcript_37068:96-1139(-)